MVAILVALGRRVNGHDLVLAQHAASISASMSTLPRAWVNRCTATDNEDIELAWWVAVQ